MNANDYQRLAARTLIDKPDSAYTDEQIMMVWNALGLTGEAGEVADAIKKAVFHRHALDRDTLIRELGDVLWYVAALCTNLNVSLSEVMDRNIAKLRQRYPDGYSSADSLRRLDTDIAVCVCGHWQHLHITGKCSTCGCATYERAR